MPRPLLSQQTRDRWLYEGPESLDRHATVSFGLSLIVEARKRHIRSCLRKL